MYNSRISRYINTWISILYSTGLLPWPAKRARSFHSIMSIQPNSQPLSSSAVGRTGRQAEALQHRSPLHFTEEKANFQSRKVLVWTMEKLKQNPIWERACHFETSVKMYVFEYNLVSPSTSRVSHRATAIDTHMWSSQHYQMVTFDLCSHLF